jgi:hypothetical protein
MDISGGETRLENGWKYLSVIKLLHDLDLDGRTCNGFMWLRTECFEHGYESSVTIKQMNRIS